MNRQLHTAGVIALVAFASAGPISALAAEPADLPALEQAWHVCVRQAYDSQQDRGSRAGRERNALDECRLHEDQYVAALMTARPDDADAPINGWARTWAAHVSFVVNPVKAWMKTLRR